MIIIYLSNHDDLNSKYNYTFLNLNVDNVKNVLYTVKKNSLVKYLVIIKNNGDYDIIKKINNYKYILSNLVMINLTNSFLNMLSPAVNLFDKDAKNIFDYFYYILTVNKNSGLYNNTNNTVFIIKIRGPIWDFNSIKHVEVPSWYTQKNYKYEIISNSHSLDFIISYYLNIDKIPVSCCTKAFFNMFNYSYNLFNILISNKSLYKKLINERDMCNTIAFESIKKFLYILFKDTDYGFINKSIESHKILIVINDEIEITEKLYYNGSKYIIDSSLFFVISNNNETHCITSIKTQKNIYNIIDHNGNIIKCKWFVKKDLERIYNKKLITKNAITIYFRETL